jgi:lipopolysaccharide biosynthesis glycosyltransferase
MKTYNVAIAINRGYFLWAMVTLNSILKNNTNNFINFYISHNNCFCEEDAKYIYNSPVFKKYKNFKIIFVDVISYANEIQFLSQSVTAIWGGEVWFKIFYAKLLPSVDKILYLDVDLIVNNNIADLFAINMDDKLFMGDKLYNAINCGALLINLKLSREKAVLEQILQYKQNPNSKTGLNEEAIINILYNNDMLFNQQHMYTLSTKRTKIQGDEIKNFITIHYVARKPWIMSSWKKFAIHFNKIYYGYYKDCVQTKFIIPYYFIMFYNVYLHRIMYSFGVRIKKFFKIDTTIVHPNKYILKKMKQISYFNDFN